MKKNWLLLLLLGVSTITLAQSVYSWKDENGVTHFGDIPQNDRATMIDIGAINSYDTDKTERVSTPATAAKQKQPEIVMYSAAWCGVCKKARAYFTQNKVSFTEYDVDTSSDGKAFQAKRTSKSVPVFLIDGKMKSGFSTGSFDKLLSLKSR